MTSHLNKPNAVKNAAGLIFYHRPNWPEPIRLIGQGAYGMVFNTNNGRAMKITTGNAQREFNTLRNLQGLHFVPRVKAGNYTNINNGMWNFSEAHMNVPNNFGGAFIMNKVGNMSLASYLKKYPHKTLLAYRRLKDLVGALQVKGYVHGNLAPRNVMVSVDAAGRIIGMWIVDWGMATKMNMHNISIVNLTNARPFGMNIAKNKALSIKYRNMRRNIAKNLALLPKSPVKRGSPRRTRSASPPKRRSTSLRRTKSLRT